MIHTGRWRDSWDRLTARDIRGAAYVSWPIAGPRGSSWSWSSEQQGCARSRRRTPEKKEVGQARTRVLRAKKLLAPLVACLANFESGDARWGRWSARSGKDMAGQRENIFMQDIFSVQEWNTPCWVVLPYRTRTHTCTINHTHTNSCETACLWNFPVLAALPRCSSALLHFQLCTCALAESEDHKILGCAPSLPLSPPQPLIHCAWWSALHWLGKYV